MSGEEKVPARSHIGEGMSDYYLRKIPVNAVVETLQIARALLYDRITSTTQLGMHGNLLSKVKQRLSSP
ncbi:hypothetical protein SERLADRAFT_481097 [Serpula lacrymans var. lacrymans S7.9]|uniref:Uncharacterized protein n=1 Tax=Serpula lacrymans var. lacrymans (strain S7.9) TaxID=578457 RepID=F8PED0_SERL9|nr:uncharacterized protein SERLADRAFT_481097 [Serpula lacrymans var. lacrymans S7.9]EGO18517.1 hypothetical protein SERLADRAFT_481097 [Serpula lacrymans var. lacrymans S7.9]